MLYFSYLNVHVPLGFDLADSLLHKRIKGYK